MIRHIHNYEIHGHGHGPFVIRQGARIFATFFKLRDALDAVRAPARGEVFPAGFTESIDASMAVIQRRWPDARVTFDRGTIRRGCKWPAWIETRSRAETHKHGEADSAAHALAISLHAALEADNG